MKIFTKYHTNLILKINKTQRKSFEPSLDSVVVTTVLSVWGSNLFLTGDQLYHASIQTNMVGIFQIIHTIYQGVYI